MPLQIVTIHPLLNTMLRQIIFHSTALAILLFPFCYKPLSASAITGEEAVKVIRVFSDYMNNLQKIFQPAPTAPTPSQPDNPIPNPVTDEPQPEPETIESQFN
jgi:hypothetical protein